MTEGPNDGHTFELTWRSRGSSAVVGNPEHTDSDWWSDPTTIQVRAWSLKAALEKAAGLPFAVLSGVVSQDVERCPRCALKDEKHWAALYFPTPECTFKEGCDLFDPDGGTDGRE